MSLSAHLQFGDNQISRYSKQYQLKEVKCHFQKSHDNVRPTSDAFCERIDVSVFIPGKEDLSLYEWFSSGSLQTGRILVEQTNPIHDNETQWHEILFEDAVCFSMKEEYKLDERRRILHLSFMAAHIEADGVVFKR